MKIICAICVICGCFFLSGCAEFLNFGGSDSRWRPVVTNLPPVIVKPATNAPAFPADAIDATTIITKKGSPASRAIVTRRLEGAKIGGGKVTFHGEPRAWKTFTGGNGKTVDAEAHLFFSNDGQFVGGQFDSIGVGQWSKGLENIIVDPASELPGRWGVMPSPGQKCYFCEVSLDGTERSNIVECEGVW